MGIIVSTALLAKNNLKVEIPYFNIKQENDKINKTTNETNIEYTKRSENNDRKPNMGEMPPNMDGQTPPSIDEKFTPTNDNQNNNGFELIDKSTITKLSIVYIISIICGILISISSILYLIFSLFGKNKVLINRDKTIIFILTTILLTIILSYLCVNYINNNILLTNIITNNKSIIRNIK